MASRSNPSTDPSAGEGHLDTTVVGRDEGDGDAEVDRRGQDEALVVVGVLADEVDPARGVHDPDRVWVGGRRRLAGDQVAGEIVRVDGCGHAAQA